MLLKFTCQGIPQVLSINRKGRQGLQINIRIWQFKGLLSETLYCLYSPGGSAKPVVSESCLNESGVGRGQ